MVLYPSANERRQRAQQQQASNFNADFNTQRMAAQQQQQADEQATPYLSSNQQDLLLAALNAQARDRESLNNTPGHLGDTKRSTSDPSASQANMGDAGLFMSPQDAQLDNLDYTPELDYLDGENSFDFDNADLGGEMIGALPGSGSPDDDGQTDGHEKRKNPDEDDDSDEADPKRQETQEGAEKGAKKPGRKPLTSEPTTKRKAQNRAAQRAFRERKEKHLKDLETKVTQLNKAHEADRHENGLLKAQVDRLSVELREYRKRLSLNNGSAGARGSPPLNAYSGPGRSNSGPSNANGNFQFDFPKFGALPGSQIFGAQQAALNSHPSNNGVLSRGSITPPITQSPTNIGGLDNLRNIPAQVSRHNSQASQNGQSMSPAAVNGTGNNSNAATPPQSNGSFPSVGYSTNNNMHGFASTLPQMNSENPFGDLFSPSLLKNANFDNTNSYFNASQQDGANGRPTQNGLEMGNGGDSTAGLNRVFQFNGGSSSSDSASPSASSTSQWNANGANSSCGTSPEPSHDSPANKAQNSIDSYSTDKNNQARQSSTSSQQLYGLPENSGNPNIALTGNTLHYSMPSADTFDPVLFGDYRDPTENAFGSTDFGANPFFDDALNTAPFDYGSPSNLFGILQSPQQTNNTLSVNSGPANAPTPSSNLMARMEKTRDGGDDDYGLPSSVQQASKPTTDKNGKLISCNNIWNQLQSNPDFQNGTFDLDSLCSELRAKARCSESGVMVSQDHVDAALKKLGKKDDKTGRFVPATSVADVPPLMFEQESWDNVLRKLGGNGR